VSSPRIAVIERLYELFNRLPDDLEERTGSPVQLELLALFHPDVEFTQPDEQVDAQTFKGRDALRQSWDDWLSTWDEHRTEIAEIAERGDRVLALSRERLRGRDGLEVEAFGASIFTFHGDEIVRFDAYFGHDTGRREFESLSS
jgi:ketosteroid isomerase-like protein